MQYEEFYTELGKLFHHVAAIDGKVTTAEKNALQGIINDTWKPLEESTKFGTDQANLITFSFDYEDSEGPFEDGFQSFKDYYEENRNMFTPSIAGKIIQTIKAIALAYRSGNKDENDMVKKVEALLKGHS